MIPGITASMINILAQEEEGGVRGNATLSNVVFLCSWNGANDATTATDDSYSQHVITFVNSAKLKTADPALGSAALELLRSIPDYCRAGPISSDWDFADQPFCIELFLKSQDHLSGGTIICCHDLVVGTNRSWYFRHQNSGQLSFSISEDGDAVSIILLSASGVITEDVWSHVCVERDDLDVFRMYVDGVMVQRAVGNPTLHTSTNPLSIGALSDSASVLIPITAQMDEIRVTKGAFWYGTDDGFTPPVAEFEKPTIVWADAYNPGPFTVDDNTVAGENHRIRIPVATATPNFLAAGTTVRVTFKASSTTALKIDSAYIGHNTSGANFIGDQVRLKFSGANGFTISAGATITSDPISFTLDFLQHVMVSYYVASSPTSGCPWLINFQSGITTYIKTASDESGTTSVSGYSASSSAPYTVQSIEAVILPVDAILDSVASVTGAWSFSRNLLTSFSGARYTDASGAIITLEDQSGSDRDFTDDSVAGQRPTLSTAGPNSRDCADFDGTTDFLTSDAISNFISAGSGALVISVMIDAYNINNATVYLNDLIFGDFSQKIGLVAKNTGGGTILGFNNTNVPTDTVLVLATGTVAVLSWRHTSGVLYAGLDGREISVSSGDTDSLTGALQIAGRAAQYCNMKVFEAFTTSDGSQTAAISTAITHMKIHIGA